MNLHKKADQGVWDLGDHGLVQVLESSGVHDDHEHPHEEKTDIQKAYLRAISLARKSIRIVRKTTTHYLPQDHSIFHATASGC